MISRLFTASLRRVLIVTPGLFFVLSIAQPIYAQRRLRMSSQSSTLLFCLAALDMGC